MRKWISGILAAFIVVFSALLALLLFTHENEIGLSGTELHADGILLETTGDSDLLDVELLDSGVFFEVFDLRLRAKSPEYGIAFCTEMYTDGEHTDSDLPEVVIDKYDDGEWQFYGNSRYLHDGYYFPNLAHYADPGSERIEEIVFDGDKPGLYRFTLFFREITEIKYNDYYPFLTTSPELRSVSFTLEVPDTGKPNNLCNTTLEKLNKNDADAAVDVNIRAADESIKSPLYLKSSSVELYESSNGRLQKIGNLSDGRVKSELVSNYTDNKAYCVFDNWDTHMNHGGLSLNYGYFVLYDIDYDKDYALKMTFFENEDGTGERYSLVLNLVFDE